MSRPRVLFIKPDFPDVAIIPHVGIGYLMAVLKKSGVMTYYLDNCLLKYDDHKITMLIKDFSPDIIGITASTPMIKRALKIAHLSKGVSNTIKVIVGGCHPSAVPDETLQEDCVDCVVMGEAEDIILNLSIAMFHGDDLSDIKKIAYKKDGPISVTSGSLLRDLDSLPFPAFEQMELQKYFSSGTKMGFQQKSLRCIPIIGTRGCPGKCTFCQRYLGSIFRKRSPDNIVDEITYWFNKFRINEFNFLDDNFTFDKKFAMETLEKILKKDLKITVRFPNGVREDFLDTELLGMLKKVGCRDLEFGFESGCQKTLNLMKKGKKVEEMVEKAYLCKRYGFKIGSNFLFGTPGETLEDMDVTIKFALSLPLDKAGFGIVIPFPGTEIREEAILKNYLVHSEYDKYNPIIEYCKPALRTPEWTGEEVIKKVLEARKKYYLRPKYIANNIFKVFSSGNVYLYAKMLLSLVYQNKPR